MRWLLGIWYILQTIKIKVNIWKFGIDNGSRVSSKLDVVTTKAIKA